MTARVEVKGLRELNRDLRRIDRALGKRTQRALKRVSEEVVEDIRSRMTTREGRLGAKGAKGVRARATQRKAKIALLGSNPVIRGLEFGAIVHPVFGRRMLQRDMARRVFPPWVGNRYTGARANFGEGYHVAFVMNEWIESGRVVHRLDEALDLALRDAL